MVSDSFMLLGAVSSTTMRACFPEIRYVDRIVYTEYLWVSFLCFAWKTRFDEGTLVTATADSRAYSFLFDLIWLLCFMCVRVCVCVDSCEEQLATEEFSRFPFPLFLLVLSNPQNSSLSLCLSLRMECVAA